MAWRKPIIGLIDRICDWIAEAHMADYDQELLDQVNREMCDHCPERKDCIGPVPMWGGVFPCRRVGERYWEIEAEKEEDDGNKQSEGIGGGKGGC